MKTDAPNKCAGKLRKEIDGKSGNFATAEQKSKPISDGLRMCQNAFRIRESCPLQNQESVRLPGDFSHLYAMRCIAGRQSR
jgi:hypothetical protein